MDKPKTQSCSQCGICCCLFLINLTKKEWLSGKYKTQFEKFNLDNNFITAKKYGGHLLSQKKDGSCIYLKNNSCSVHRRRPQSCKDFFCKSKLKKFKRMISLIEEKRTKKNKKI
jgi:Fe-S-cluster containining protein